MRKILISLLLLAACRHARHDGTYVAHTKSDFSIANDTLIVADTLIMNHTGYQKIRNGELLPKAIKVRSWTLHSPDAPPMIFDQDRIIIGQTIYTKLP